MTYGPHSDDANGPVWEDVGWDGTAPSHKHWALGLASAAAVAALLGGAAVAVLTNGNHPPKRVTVTGTSLAPSPIDSAEPSESPTDPVTESPSAVSSRPSSKASPARSTSAANPAPAAAAARQTALPVRKPTFPAMPKPTASPSPSKNCTPSHEGTDLPKAEIRGYMEQLSTTALYHKSQPDLRVPLNLMKAIAYQESGWQSSIVACDGGVGTMQVMPGTSAWMDGEFGTKLDIHQPRANITQGAQYLAFMIKRFGSAYDPPIYDVMQNDMLLKSVISGYQAGPGAVDPTKGDAGLPNPDYVKSVRALMTNCPCFSF